MKGVLHMETIFIIIFAILYLSVLIIISSSCQTGLGSIMTFIIGGCLAVPIFYLVAMYIGLVIILILGGLFLLGSND